MFWKKKPTEPLTEQEEKIKQYTKKQIRQTLGLFLVTLSVSFIGMALYSEGILSAGSYLVPILPLWGIIIIIFIIDSLKIQRFTTKVYFESIQPKDQ